MPIQIKKHGQRAVRLAKEPAAAKAVLDVLPYKATLMHKRSGTVHRYRAASERSLRAMLDGPLAHGWFLVS